MRTIEYASTFRRDYKREVKGPHRNTLQTEFPQVLVALQTDQPLEARYRDHALSGELAGYRDCHIRPDLVLIYRKPNAETLQLVRLGSHSELFG